ncbi:MAG: SDR family oxidoreductase [Thermoanaerobaculia bacterium]|nr:SDR family oxidoreductase [Thermoanaerobaculia bacterium]
MAVDDRRAEVVFVRDVQTWGALEQMGRRFDRQPTRRFSTVEEIGAMVVYLCTDLAGNVTGTNLSNDGGWTRALSGRDPATRAVST